MIIYGNDAWIEGSTVTHNGGDGIDFSFDQAGVHHDRRHRRRSRQRRIVQQR